MNQTMQFKEVFETVDKFVEFCKKTLPEATQAEDTELFKEIYYLLYNRYLGCGIAYDSPDLFCAELAICMREYFQQFKKREKIIADIYKLTAEDYANMGETISNFANNPNYKTTGDPWAFLDYVSTQSRAKGSTNRLAAYINALRQQPDMQKNAFIQKVDYLWLDILPDEIVLFDQSKTQN